MANRLILPRAEQERRAKRIFRSRPTHCRQNAKEDIMIEEKDLNELRQSLFTGVTVGVGSMVLTFSNGVQILVQCPFERIDLSDLQHGHGEHLMSSPLLFDMLNHRVTGAEFDSESVLTVTFDNAPQLRIVPEANGFESYVVTTKFGQCPVMIC
jgi:hypothetical protein